MARRGRTVDEVFAVIEERIEAEVEAIAEANRRGQPVWPEVDYADIAAGRVPPAVVAQLHRRGCIVVRNHFEREQALAWDADIVDYVETNRFFEIYRGDFPAEHYERDWTNRFQVGQLNDYGRRALSIQSREPPPPR
jgi:Protein of unknown function (DUF1479)